MLLLSCRCTGLLKRQACSVICYPWHSNKHVGFGQGLEVVCGFQIDTPPISRAILLIILRGCEQEEGRHPRPRDIEKEREGKLSYLAVSFMQ